MNPNLDLIRVDRILSGGPIRKAFWSLVHKMPCAIVHRACPLCRDEGMCNRCREAVFDRAATARVTVTSSPYLLANCTWTTASNVTYRFPES